MKILKNKSFLIPFVEIFAKAISFFNILLFVSILPIEEYADYSYIVAIVMWSSVLMDGGINSLIYNKSLKKETEGINVLFTSRLFLSITVILCLGLLLLSKKENLAISGIIFSIVIYFSSTSSLVKMISRGLGFIKVDFISILSEPLIRFIFLLFIYYSSNYINYDLWEVLFIYLIAGIIAFLINKHFLNIYFSLKLGFSSVNKLAINIIDSIKQSKYYLLYYLVFVGIGRLDQMFLEHYSSKNELAIFSFSLNIYQAALLFFVSIITSQFIKLYKNEFGFLKKLIPFVIIIIILTNVLSSFMFDYLFPKDYSKGQQVLNVLIIALLPSIVNYYMIIKNNYENKVRNNFIILFIIFLIKIIIYYIIQPTDMMSYCYIYLIIEGLLFLLFSFKMIYENITNKQVS